jgi:predicted transcriptional regulator
MAFRFDKTRALKPVKVSWRLSAATVAELERIAGVEQVKVEDVAQQALDQVLERRRRGGKEQRAGENEPQE